MPVANFTVNNVCDGTPINPYNLSTIQSGNLSYYWSFGDADISIVPDPNHVYSEPGIYRLVLSVQSENACADSLARYVQVYELPIVDAGPDVVISKGDEVRLSGSGGVLFTWFPSLYLSNATVANPLASPSESIEYILQGEDAHACVNYDTVFVQVNDDFKIHPNNIITPDGNGINDFWYIENIDSYSACEVYIFDRIGNMVYHKESYSNDWNGENLNGDILPDGTYYYAVTFEDSEVVYKGSISILRNK
jgi:gliding motility-associated-like protein